MIHLYYNPCFSRYYFAHCCKCAFFKGLRVCIDDFCVFTECFCVRLILDKNFFAQEKSTLFSYLQDLRVSEGRVFSYSLGKSDKNERIIRSKCRIIPLFPINNGEKSTLSCMYILIFELMGRLFLCKCLYTTECCVHVPERKVVCTPLYKIECYVHISLCNRMLRAHFSLQ